jgi:hypothetical protein
VLEEVEIRQRAREHARDAQAIVQSDAGAERPLRAVAGPGRLDDAAEKERVQANGSPRVEPAAGHAGGEGAVGPSFDTLIELMAEPEAERIGFQSVTESIDTTTPGGKLVFRMTKFASWSASRGRRFP